MRPRRSVVATRATQPEAEERPTRVVSAPQVPGELPPDLVRDLRALLKEMLVRDYRDNRRPNGPQGSVPPGT